MLDVRWMWTLTKFHSGTGSTRRRLENWAPHPLPKPGAMFTQWWQAWLISHEEHERLCLLAM